MREAAMTVTYAMQRQTIRPDGFALGGYGLAGQALFHLASMHPLPDIAKDLPQVLHPLAAQLYHQTGIVPQLNMWPPWRLKSNHRQVDDNHMVLGFSGGKDSVAVALMAMARGMQVTLMHVTGLNRSYPQEAKTAQATADHMGLPLVIRKVVLTGRAGDPDNPDLDNRFKNQFIMGLQMDLATKLGAGVIGQGNHAGDSFDNVQPNSWFTDAKENYDLMQAAYPEFTYKTGKLINVAMVYDTILKIDPDILPHLGSCIMAQRFVKYRHDQTIAKYGVTPLTNRCGCCYKCCWEYLCLTDQGLYPWSDAYAAYCIDRVHKCWPLFYKDDLQPHDRPSVVAAIMDQSWLPTPSAIHLANTYPKINQKVS